jgi:hypothetical protein
MHELIEPSLAVVDGLASVVFLLGVSVLKKLLTLGWPARST